MLSVSVNPNRRYIERVRSRVVSIRASCVRQIAVKSGTRCARLRLSNVSEAVVFEDFAAHISCPVCMAVVACLMLRRHIS